jgi:septum formation protein
MQPDLVLASTSPYRLALLKRLNLPFRCVRPRFDESSIRGHDIEPARLAEILARGKAESIAELEPLATVIGCDQVVSLDGRILGKPGSLPAAAAQLEAMSGRSHELVTSLLVAQGHQRIIHTDVTRLWMRALLREEIDRYVQRDQPVDCAGSYKLEEGGITLFERIKSEDQTAITGLPLIGLTSILRALGYAVP